LGHVLDSRRHGLVEVDLVRPTVVTPLSKAVAKAGKVTTTTGRDAYHHRIFSYSAVAVGKTTIKLGFFEPGRNQPGRTITITLTVLQ
jgi:hypothetical protein